MLDNPGPARGYRLGAAAETMGGFALAVGADITAAYWFTASTSFANPAVTLARCATDTFSGIRPADVPGFLAAQVIGAATVFLASRFLFTQAGRGRRGPPSTVVFACVHDAGRSQMAAALFNELADPTRVRAVSAGTMPVANVHPEVVEAMHEVGTDLSAATPSLLNPRRSAARSSLSRWAAARPALPRRLSPARTGPSPIRRILALLERWEALR